MTSYTENKPLVLDTLVPGVLVLARGNPLKSDVNVLARSDVNVLEKRYVESLDELDRIALNVARSTLGSLFSLEKSNHYMEWKSAQRDRSAQQIGLSTQCDLITACLDRSAKQNA
jgi:hypothetical protein